MTENGLSRTYSDLTSWNWACRNCYELKSWSIEMINYWSLRTEYSLNWKMITTESQTDSKIIIGSCVFDTLSSNNLTSFFLSFYCTFAHLLISKRKERKQLWFSLIYHLHTWSISVLIITLWSSTKFGSLWSKVDLFQFL